MDGSIFLAKAFSIYFVIMGVAMLGCKNYFEKAVIEISKDNGLGLLTSIFTLILGILLVLYHNVWVYDWHVIVTVLAWLTLIKGTARLLFAEKIAKWAKPKPKKFKNNYCYYGWTVFLIVLGAYLGWMGFFHVSSTGFFSF